MKDTDSIKKEIFDVEDSADKAFSLFEVINTVNFTTEEIDPEIAKVVRDNFWDLL